MAYQSGEFNLPFNGDGILSPGAATAFNGTVFLLNSSSFGIGINQLFGSTLTSFDLTKLIRTGSTPAGEDPINDTGLKDPDNWKSDTGPGFGGVAQPALVATADTMYAFINEMVTQWGPNKLIACEYTLPQNNPGQPGTWGGAISLLESDGQTAPLPAAPRSGMSAAVVGANIIIVTCSSASSATNPTAGTYVGVYDTATIDADKNTWAAQWHTYLPLENGLSTDNAFYVWTDWYSSTGEGDEPGFYLGILVESASTPAAKTTPDFYYWNLPMAVTETAGKTSVRVTVPSTGAYSEGFNNSPPTPYILSSLKRDPAGRLRVWASTPRDTWSTGLSAGIISTDKPQIDGIGINFFDETLAVTYRDSTDMPPTSLFYIFNEGMSETTVNGKQAAEYPVYEFVFYGYELQTCQVVRCGTIQVITGFSEPTLKQPSTELNIIAGIIDGPVPIPIKNYQGHNMGSDTYEAGSITYGTTDTNTKERKVSNSWTVGFETSGEATSGVGPAWDISFKGGMGSVSGESEETSLSYYLEQGASISFKDLNATLNPTGSLRKVGVQFSISAFSYIDNFGPSVDSTTAAPADAPKPASVLTRMVDPGGLNFSSFLFTPGDLSSYTPEAINAKMKPYGHDNYYSDVICQNAYPFGNPDEPFLSFTYSPSSKNGQAFSQFTDSFRESSWSLDTKIYLGVSGGTDIFGVEEFEMKFLAGVEYQHESTESENSGTEWGIELSTSWILPEGNTPDSVDSYDFRVFFLPVPSAPSTLSKTYWTEEVMKYMPPDSETQPDMIDPNSGCWRITYAVTRIQYKDEATYPTYTYTGPNKPSLYKSTNKAAIRK